MKVNPLTAFALVTTWATLAWGVRPTTEEEKQEKADASPPGTPATGTKAIAKIVPPTFTPECSYSVEVAGGVGDTEKRATSHRRAAAWCTEALLPRHPRLLVELPGAFLIGGVVGAGGAVEFIIAPAVTIAPILQFPIVSPKIVSLFPYTNDKGEEMFGFRRPRVPQWVTYGMIGFSTSIAGLTLPNPPAGTDGTAIGFTAGMLTGFQFGVEWWDGEGIDGKRRQALINLALVGAYAKADNIGDAFFFGAQPSLSVNF